MSNALVAAEPPRSVLNTMSERYGMMPEAFEQTVRQTCMKAGNNRDATREEFAAFLLVAKEYGLNPLTKEIYAFPAKGGGIVPVVGIDGWVNLVNSHPACDGFDFSFDHDDKGNLISCTCSMHRKDRNRPVIVTEFLVECQRNTEPWKMRHRMLRHKAMIQAARYAFGFAGIYDPDEAERFADMRDVTPQASQPPAPPADVPRAQDKVSRQESARAAPPAAEERRSAPPAPPAEEDEIEDAEVVDESPNEAYIVEFDSAMAKAATLDELKAVWGTRRRDLGDEDSKRIAEVKDAHKLRIERETENSSAFDLGAFKGQITEALGKATSADQVQHLLDEVDGAVEAGSLSEADKEEHFTDLFSEAFARFG